MSRLGVAVSLLLLLAGLFAGPAEAANAPVEVAVILSPTQQTINGTGNESPLVQYAGNVRVDTLPFLRAVVSLDPSCDIGWPVSIDPPQMVFGAGGGTAPFNLTVRVPPHVSNNTTAVRVKAVATAGILSAETESAAVLIVTGSAPPPPSNDTTAVLKIDITPPGNGPAPVVFNWMHGVGLAAAVTVAGVAGYGYRRRRRRGSGRRAL